jgi:hypothetical protein
MSGAEEARGVFSAAHIIYIPLCILAGIFLGWFLGARGSRAEVTRLRQLLEAEEARAADERIARLGRKG